MATTLANMIEMVCRAFGGYAKGTLTAVVDGGTDTDLLTDSALIGQSVPIGSAITVNGQVREVKDFDPTTGAMTCCPDFAPLPAVPDAYEVLPMPRVEVIACVQKAVRAAGQTWLGVKIDETIQVQMNTNVYDAPLGLVNVIAAWSKWAGWLRPYNTFEVSEKAGQNRRQIVLKEVPSFKDATAQASNLQGLWYLKLQYTALPTVPVNDADTFGLDDVDERDLVAFVENYALMEMHRLANKAQLTSEQSRAHNRFSQDYLAEAERIRMRATGPRVTRRMTRPSIGAQI